MACHTVNFNIKNSGRKKSKINGCKYYKNLIFVNEVCILLLFFPNTKYRQKKKKIQIRISTDSECGHLSKAIFSTLMNTGSNYPSKYASAM
jgi:hypothetical protein